MNKLSIKSNSGQAILVVLLIMAVVLTIGLSTVSRSVTDIKISEQTEDSARAFSAAEAGIESYLAGTSSTFDFGTGVSVSLAPSSLLSADSKTFLYPKKNTQNEVATIWLSTYEKKTGLYSNLLSPSAPGQSLTVAWGNPGTAPDTITTPALEVTIYYKDNLGINKMTKYLLDTASVVTRDNGFCKKTDGSGSCLGVTFGNGVTYGGQSLPFSATLNVSSLNSMYFARLRLLYNDTAQYLGFGSFAPLPSQGDKIAATGTSNQATRKVEVYRLNSAPPDVFDFALYSGGSLIK